MRGDFLRLKRDSDSGRVAVAAKTAPRPTRARKGVESLAVLPLDLDLQQAARDLGVQAITKKALELYQQAIEQDPTYALAYAGTADCYVHLGFTPYGRMKPSDAYPPRQSCGAESPLAERRAR